jgi:predicted Zn-dependent peptidase
MSSRLFQSIREERGLAYSIYSELNPFRDTGSLAVYAGCAIANLREVLTLTLAEFTRLKSEPVTAEELDRARNQTKGNMVLGLESSSSRMSSLARQQMYWGRFFSLDEITAEIDRVTAADLQRLARQLFQPDQLALTLLGNLGPLKLTRADLTCFLQMATTTMVSNTSIPDDISQLATARSTAVSLLIRRFSVDASA